MIRQAGQRNGKRGQYEPPGMRIEMLGVTYAMPRRHFKELGFICKRLQAQSEGTEGTVAKPADEAQRQPLHPNPN